MLNALLLAVALPVSLEGTWRGTVGVATLEIQFQVGEERSTATIRNLENPWNNPQTVAVAAKDGVYEFTLARTAIRINEEGGELRSVVDPPVRLTRASDLPPIAQIPFSVSTSEGRLAGVMIRPQGSAGVPVALMVPGRGGGRRMNLGMGIEFARRGMAFVSMDEPGTGESEGSLAQDSHAKKIARYTAVVDALLKRDDIDPKRIGLVSNSAGGWTSPAICVSRPVAFWIGLVSPSESVIAQQRSSFQMLLDAVQPPLSSEEMKEAQGFVNAMLDVVAGRRTKEDVEALRKSLEGKRFAEAAEVPKAVFEDNLSWIGRFSYDPAPDLAKSKAKTLIVLGGADPVVPHESNAKLYREILGSRVEVVVAPGVGHGLAGPFEGRVRLSPEARSAVERFVDSVVKGVGD